MAQKQKYNDRTLQGQAQRNADTPAQNKINEEAERPEQYSASDNLEPSALGATVAVERKEFIVAPADLPPHTGMAETVTPAEPPTIEEKPEPVPAPAPEVRLRKDVVSEKGAVALPEEPEETPPVLPCHATTEAQIAFLAGQVQLLAEVVQEMASEREGTDTRNKAYQDAMVAKQDKIIRIYNNGVGPNGRYMTFAGIALQSLMTRGDQTLDPKNLVPKAFLYAEEMMAEAKRRGLITE